MQPNIIRPLLEKDQSLLWDIFHIALWDPPPAGLRPREILEHPDVRIYAEGWGRAGDIGFVCESVDALHPIGGAWMRTIAGGAGLAYIDDNTP
jgi:hypothetical protein